MKERYREEKERKKRRVKRKNKKKEKKKEKEESRGGNWVGSSINGSSSLQVESKKNLKLPDLFIKHIKFQNPNLS